MKTSLNAISIRVTGFVCCTWWTKIRHSIMFSVVMVRGVIRSLF